MTVGETVTTTGPLVDAVGVTRRFGQFVANDHINLRIESGEVVGLLGANGAGKSTFMRQLLGLLQPTSGVVRLFGKPPSRAIRRRVGYVPQGLGLYGDLTVAENLEFAARAYGTPIPDLAAEPALQAEASTLVAELPLGLRRRLAFAAALAHNPSLLILDEPTSGVDPLGRGALWDTIRDCADRGAGVVVSTHYMEEAEHCDRVVVLVDGRVVVEGTLANIIGGRRAIEIDASHWDTAFQALDDAGIVPALSGRRLRVIGADETADEARVRAVLRRAGVEATTRLVPASFEEAFVALVVQGEKR